jgi:type VI secretion system secreted protein Hcp
MAIDAHIKFDGIEGESTSADHKGEIVVLAWSWGLTSPAASTSGGRTRGKSTPSDLSFTHFYDKASPVLAKTAAQRKHVKTAVLTARKAGEGQKDFLKVTMKEVFITSVATAEDGTALTEVVTLSYNDIAFSYRPQDSKGGLGGEVKFDWNIKTGQVV